MAQHFHPLEIKDVRRETADCISVAFEIPDELKDAFAYRSGQYVTLRAEVGDQELRRSYSLCSAPLHHEWRIAIKRVDDGMFSQWAHALLRAGESIDVLPPDGHFKYPPEGEEPRNVLLRHSHVLLLAAGSGITPILSILTTLLEQHPKTNVTLVYGNRRVNDIIFKEQIEDLRDQYLTRFQLIHTLSGEIQEAPIANGRLDGAKLSQLFGTLIDPKKIDHVYICGPNEMIASCVEACVHAGMAADRVHKELFGAPTGAPPRPQRDASSGDGAKVLIVADGIERELVVPYRGESVLDIVLRAGIDVPYACKAGVCCTCRAQVLEGEVRMDANYTLEQHEVDRGFVLTCQSHPATPIVKLSYDAR